MRFEYPDPDYLQNELSKYGLKDCIIIKAAVPSLVATIQTPKGRIELGGKMGKEHIRVATREDMSWINLHYESVDFPVSDYDTELLLILEVNTYFAGIGRLRNIEPKVKEVSGIFVLEAFRKLGFARKIVQHLLDTVKGSGDTIFCLPFTHLESFYCSFGFRKLNLNLEANKVPVTLIQKLSANINKLKTPISMLMVENV